METRNEIKRLLLEAVDGFYLSESDERRNFWDGVMIGMLDLIYLLGITYPQPLLERIQRNGMSYNNREDVEKTIELCFKDWGGNQ